jgi:glycosyltransferase involved in cell wall biosynthesis
MKLVVFSICKDEEATIGELVDRIPRSINGVSEIQVLVVSDGSTDRTAEIALSHGAIVVEGRHQRRLAFRFQQAIDIVLGMGADVAVNIDGDLQFDPEDIPALLDPILTKRAQFVAADRFTDPETGVQRKPDNMPPPKYWGNRLGARVVGTLTNQSFSDVTCGFRAYSREALLALNINTKYTYTQESFQILANSGIDIETMPTKVTYFPGRKSRVVTNFWSFLATSGINILRAYRDFAPLRFFFALSLLPLLFGVGSSSFVGLRWLFTGQTSPFTSLGIIGVYMFSFGLFLLVMGLVADMQVRLTKTQEKTLKLLKREHYERRSAAGQASENDPEPDRRSEFRVPTPALGLPAVQDLPSEPAEVIE